MSKKVRAPWFERMGEQKGDYEQLMTVRRIYICRLVVG